MAIATTSDGVKLHYETAGSGTPIVFVHEFGGNHWSWEPQMSFFTRRHQCLTFAARGFPPSEIPQDVTSYSQARAADDIFDIMDCAGLARAHLVGLSMGGFAVLHAGLRRPERVLSVCAAGAGYGAETSENVWRPAISSEKSGVSARDEAPGGRLVPVAGTSKPLKAGRLKRSPKHLALDRSGAAPADH